MTIRTLPKSEWQSYFDHFSRRLAGESAVVEIQGLEFIGDRRQARCLPLIGIAYDSQDDTLEIAMEGLDHLIHQPHDIVIADGAKGLEHLEVVDRNEQKQIVKLVKPLRYRQRD